MCVLNLLLLRDKLRVEVPFKCTALCWENSLWRESFSDFLLHFKGDIFSVTQCVGVAQLVLDFSLMELLCEWLFIGGVCCLCSLEEWNLGASNVAILVTWRYNYNTDEKNRKGEAMKLRK